MLDDWTGPDAIWDVDLGGPKEACVRWRCTLVAPGKYDWTVCAAAISVKLLWPRYCYYGHATVIQLQITTTASTEWWWLVSTVAEKAD